MLFLWQTASSVAHAANAQAEQWRDEVAQWHALWTWEIISGVVLLILLAVLIWQNAELKKQIERLLNRTAL